MTQNACVLVVEDEPTARETICETLEAAGCKALGASDGGEARQRLEGADHLPCVILLDLMMPNVDGWEFRAWQRTDPRFSSVPVVLLSAVRDLRSHAANLGTDYVEKPTSFPTLMKVVTKYCGPCDAG